MNRSNCLTSTTAFKCASSRDIERLYFQTAYRNDFQMGSQHVSPRGRSISLGEIHEIGRKSTKFCPMRYKTAPLPGRDQCWYAKDYNDKSMHGTLNLNREMAEVFKGGRVVVSPPMMVRTTHHQENYLRPTTAQVAFANGSVTD